MDRDLYAVAEIGNAVEEPLVIELPEMNRAAVGRKLVVSLARLKPELHLAFNREWEPQFGHQRLNPASRGQDQPAGSLDTGRRRDLDPVALRLPRHHRLGESQLSAALPGEVEMCRDAFFR